MEQQNRPSESSFYNQRLKAWHPILTPKWVIISFTLVALVFVPVGIVLLVASNSVEEMKVTYDGQDAEIAQCEAPPFDTTGPVTTDGPVCNHTFTLTADMDAPIYVYYELENFYQNHRRYVKSRDDEQLRGEVKSEGSLTACDPRETARDSDKVLHPCGLIANSYFNDYISLESAVRGLDTLTDVQMLENDISWSSDREHKFKAVSQADRNRFHDTHQFINETYPSVPDVTDEHFIVWMRTAALPTFRKLYGRIEVDLKEGTRLTFSMRSNFPVQSFDGSKTLVVSTVSFLGGKNPFLGIAYIVVGLICLVFAVAFGVKQWHCPREPGDVSSLSWQR